MTNEWILDSDLGEALHDNEMAQAISESIATTVREEYAKEGPPARRDAHPKAHGCVSAEFRVEDILPPNLAQGIFCARQALSWLDSIFQWRCDLDGRPPDHG